MTAETLLKELVSTAQTCGGLVRCNNGHIPYADLEWSDLGNVIVAAHQHLVNAGLSTAADLTIVEYDGSIDEYIAENE